MTHEEAKLQAETDNLNAYRPFCPLISGSCDTNCVCWQKAKIYELPNAKDKEKRWRVTCVGCTNQMFTRECNHDI